MALVVGGGRAEGLAVLSFGGFGLAVESAGGGHGGVVELKKGNSYKKKTTTTTTKKPKTYEKSPREKQTMKLSSCAKFFTYAGNAPTPTRVHMQLCLKCESTRVNSSLKQWGKFLHFFLKKAQRNFGSTKKKIAKKRKKILAKLFTEDSVCVI